MSTSDTLARMRRGAKRPGLADDERHAACAFEEAHLVPETAFAEHFAMVAEEDDDRVLGEAARLERRHEPAEIVVDVGDGAEIGVARVARLSLRHRLGVHRADVAQPTRMRIECSERNWRPGQIDVLVAIEIPVALRHGERVVRMGERSDEQEGPPVVRPSPYRRSRVRRRRRPRRRSRAGWCARRRRPRRPNSCCGTSSAARPDGPSPASSHSRPGRCRSSAAPRNHAAGRDRRSASCRRGWCDSLEACR